MKYGLLENGIDSLKAAFNCLDKLPDLKEGTEHNLKDAILNLNHGIEILFKLLLRNQHEYLMFVDLKIYMNAKEAMLQHGKNNVFEVNRKLKTVSLDEAIRRVELLCDIEVGSNYKAAINFINNIRNEIMHYEIIMTSVEVAELTEKLKSCYELSIDFFDKHIGNIQELLVAARFEITEQDWSDEMAEIYGEMQYEEWKETRHFENE